MAFTLKPIDPDTYYTPEEAAALLPLSPVTVAAYVRRGKLEGCRVGERVYVKGSSLASMVKGAAVPAAPEPDPAAAR